MSWTRRVLVTCAFALMLAGVVLMVTQKEELFLALSVVGFALVLVAVPSLPKEAAGEDRAPGVAPPPRTEPPAAVTEPPGTEAVTVPASDETEPGGREAEPEPVAPAGPRAEVPPPGGAAGAGTVAAQPPPPPGAAASAAPAEYERGGGTTELSARNVAIAGAAAGVVVWLWRRVRR